MNIQTIKVNTKLSFEKIAKSVVALARQNNVIIRFTKGGHKFQASPKTSPFTLIWEATRFGVIKKRTATKKAPKGWTEIEAGVA